MKNLNKILALVIVLAMALTTVAFAGTFSDVTSEESYSEAVEVMAALGLLTGYEDGTFGPDKTITRAEFAAVIVRALGMEDSAKGSAASTMFSDVASDNWAAGYVVIASQQNIIKGYPDGTFKPNNVVKYEEAVTMIIRALGYEPKFANVENAYPTSYLAQANTSGITTGAMLSIGSEASRAIVARLVYNALDVEKMEQTAFGSDVEYSVPNDAETLLSENLNVAKLEGNIESISFDNEENKLTYNITKVAEQYEANGLYFDGPFEVGTEDFTYADGVNLVKFYSTVAYVDMSDDSEPVILAIVEKAGKNKTLQLTATQTKGGSYDGKVLSYYKNSAEEDSKATEVKADGAKIYANLNATELTLDAFKTGYAAGKYPVVTLIDNDSTKNGYEYIYVTDYYSAVVAEKNDRTYRLTLEDKHNTTKSGIYLNPTAEDYTFSITDVDGAVVAYEDIQIGDVVNVFESADDEGNEYYEVVVSSEKIEGSVSEDNGDGEYVINGETYTVDDDVVLNAGDTGVFSVDMYGIVLKYELGDASNRSFGVLYALYEDTNGIDNEPKAIIYTADGAFTTYSFAKNVNANYNALDPNATGSYATVKNTDIAEKLDDNKQRIVMFAVNSSNEINELYWGEGIKKRDENYKAGSGDGTYRASTSKLDGEFIPENFTFVTLSDPDWQAADKLDRTSFGIATSAVLSEDHTEGYKFEFVTNERADGEMTFAVLFDLKARTDKASDVMYVTSVGTGTDAEGNKAKIITGTVGGEKVSFTATEAAGEVVMYDAKDEESAATVSDIAKGDVLQFALNADNEALAIRVLFDASVDAALIEDGDYAVELGDDEDDDEIGFIVAGQVNDIEKRNVVIDGTDYTVSSSVAGMLLRGERVFATEEITIDIVETDKVVYDKVPEGEDAADYNDDFVWVYKFDGDTKAVVIIDTDADDIWN